MPRFGLLGYPLGHSFSQRYFMHKFQQEGLHDHSYELFELDSITAFPGLWADAALQGVNVTIPYKQSVIPYLDKLDVTAAAVGAVNTIKRMPNGQLIGYNTDVVGFEEALRRWLPLEYFLSQGYTALILGTGGASRAVAYVLARWKLPYRLVSRREQPGVLSYTQLAKEGFGQARLLINTTPLGMHPHIDTLPHLPYADITAEFYFYDLVYNPPLTAFLRRGIEQGAKVQNGLEMLHLQAEAAWQLWCSV